MFHRIPAPSSWRRRGRSQSEYRDIPATGSSCQIGTATPADCRRPAWTWSKRNILLYTSAKMLHGHLSCILIPVIKKIKSLLYQNSLWGQTVWFYMFTIHNSLHFTLFLWYLNFFFNEPLYFCHFAVFIDQSRLWNCSPCFNLAHTKLHSSERGVT